MNVVGKKPSRASQVEEPLESQTDTKADTGDDGVDRNLLELVGARLRDARARRFITRKTLAEQSGISLAYLARVENGTGNISLGLLQRLALTLNLPIASFLSPEEPAGADFTLIVEFLKRQPLERLARIRRLLFASDARRIALVGIRGVGKSTLGPLLAERLGFPFIELNREIEKEADLEIEKIHSLYGQRGYRLLERTCLERIVGEYPEVVLATGGGIVAEAATYELLLGSFFTVWLTATPAVMFERVLAQHDARIASEDMRSEAVNNIARTFEARQHLYELAHSSYDNTDKSIEQTVPDLLSLLPEHLRRPSVQGGVDDSNSDRSVWTRT